MSTLQTHDHPLPSPERLPARSRFENSYGSLAPGQPLVAAGDRVIGVSGGAVFALDIFTGREPDVDPRETAAGFPYMLQSFTGEDPRVTANAGVVYFMDGEELKALRLSDGIPLQRRDKTGEWIPWESPKLKQVSALLAVDDKVVAVHLGARGQTSVSGFTAIDGVRAFGPIAVSKKSPGPIGYGEGAVFFVAEGKLHAVNVDFGDLRFERTKGGSTTEPLSLVAAPCVARDVVLAAGASLHFFDAKTGAELFTPVAPANPRAQWTTPILADKGKVFIACNEQEIVAVRTADGTVAWRNTQLSALGTPTLNRGQLLVTTDRRSMLAVVSATTGVVERRMKLPEIAGTHTPVVTNDTVFIPDANGWIEMCPFGKQHAAYFDGRASYVDVEADDEQFDFGTNDFTLEAWIRSSEGGEIVSSYPTVNDPDANGFRLNVGENGELRVAIVNGDETRMHAGRTRETRANDGEWHHVALIRRDGQLLALLDGKAHDVFFKDGAEAGLSIGGRSALTIGAYRGKRDGATSRHFKGLIRELRIWDRALDVATVQNNRHVQLTGTEPRLKGLWSLAEVQLPGNATAPANAVDRHTARSTFHNAASKPTDLSLDRSGFPYLLHELESHWPYAGTWAARGEQTVASSAVLAGNAVAFATSNALYGVRRADGRRLWQMDVANGVSTPAADGSRLLVVTGDDGVLAVDAMSGESVALDAFRGFVSGPGPFAAPAASLTHLAVAAPSEKVRIVTRGVDPVKTRDVVLPAPAREIRLGDTHLYSSCGTGRDLQIVAVDLERGTSTPLPVTNPTFATSMEWLFCMRGGQLTRLALSRPDKPQTQAKAPATGAITGMAVRHDDDLLVVTTDAGTVHGYSMSALAERWSATLPVARNRTTNAVHTPAFDAAGRVYCTTASGVAAVLDPTTGERVGLYMGVEPITTPPTLAAATAFYGCAEPEDPKAYRDGALHSVVFGETMSLRLGLDERGAPSRAKPYGVVEIDRVDPRKHTLHRIDPTHSCVEAWINVPTSRANSARRPGGGIIGVCPTSPNGFDLNLWIGEDGTLHYTSRARVEGQWTLLQADAETSIADGRWHHVAVSRDRADNAAIYVDGQPVSGLRVEQVASTAPRTASGIKAFLGAVANDELEAERPFCGMIAELRLWDTSIEPADIAARMHAKLRGNEPDLLAYWNFDLRTLDDAGPEHHDAALVGVAKDPVWWLTDLAFEKPSYPFVTTAAKIIDQETGSPTIYEVKFTVHRADGSGLPNHPLDLWYVRHADDEPAAVSFDGNTVAAGTPVSYVTRSDGTATVTITPTRTGHLPAIDLRAGFMARNARLHVNVLLDEQSLAAPPPPSLIVQSKLIQDYSHSPGGKVNEERDRSTWRTVIRAVNPNGTPRVGEPVTVWGGAQMTVDVKGRKHAINTENAAELETDGEGELVIVFDAKELTAPTLSARAGFMHRNDRIVIAPDQDLHRTLGDLKGSDLTAKRPTRQSKDMGENDGEALLTGETAQHADKVAGAITTVMAGAKPAESKPAPAPRRMLRAKAAASELDPMQQPDFAIGRDRVMTLRSTAHVVRTAPVNPDGLRTALGGNAGFMFETSPASPAKRGPGGIRFVMLETRDEVDVARGEATVEAPLVQGFFDDIWSGIKDVATTIYEGATKIVVSIAEKIEVAIHTMVDEMTKIVHVVVDSVVDAVNAVAGFFEQIGVLIMKAIEFLRALFNWKAILRTKNIIKQLIVSCVDEGKKSLAPDRIDRAFAPLLDLKLPSVFPEKRSISAMRAEAGDAQSPALDEARGVQGQVVMQKSRDSTVSTASTKPAPRDDGADSSIDGFFDQIPSLMTGILDLSPADLVARIMGAFQDGINAIMLRVKDDIKRAASGVVTALDWVMSTLGAEIRIPFLSELYEWIAGSPLTLLDLICLGLAVPVHVAHLAVTTLMGRMSTFADDNGRLVEAVTESRRLRAAPPPPKSGLLKADTPYPIPDWSGTNCETLIIVARALNIAAGLGSDSMFTKAIMIGGVAGFSQAEARLRGLVKIGKALTGILASELTSHASAWMFDERMRKLLDDDALWNKIRSKWWAAEPVFGILLIGDLVTLVGGVISAASPPTPATAGADGLLAAPDQGEYKFALVMRWICLGMLIARIVVMILSLVFAGAKATAKFTAQVTLLGVRDLCMIISRAPWYLYTQMGANEEIRKRGKDATASRYRTVTTVRAVSQTIALATHVAAVYTTG